KAPFRAIDGRFLASVDRLFERHLWHSANRRRNLNGTDATSAYAKHAACVFGRRPPEGVCERFEILHNRCQVELVAGTGKASQPHALEAMMGLEVRKTHLELLAVVTRFFECRRAFKSTHMIASVLVDVARDYALRRVRAALGLERTRAAIAGARRVPKLVLGGNAPRRLQKLAHRADVNVTFFVELELVA